MKTRIIYFFALIVPLFFSVNLKAQFSPAAGKPGTTAIYKDSSVFIAWAVGCVVERGFINISNPGAGYVFYGSEENATGPAEGNSTDIVSLGDGGEATLTFDPPVANGEGWDFAVFENSFTDYFLELAFVEVSSDDENFFRFESVSLTDTVVQVDTFGELNPEKLHNLAGKYRQGFGVPFDLSELDNILGLDIAKITHIRIIDIVGSIDDEYARYDSEGRKINDPWPTPFESGGFDLDAIGVIHTSQSSTEEHGLTEGINIFPNPCPGYLNISFASLEKVESIRIISRDGKSLFNLNKINNSKIFFDLSDYPDDLYFISIKLNGRFYCKKILKTGNKGKILF